MAIPNIKTYIRATLRPHIVAIRQVFLSQLNFLTKLSRRQDKSIVDTQATVAKLEKEIILYKGEVLNLSTEAHALFEKVHTSAELDEYIKRQRELSSICQILYNKVADSLPDDEAATLPDFKDPYEYPEDLEKAWREAHKIPEDHVLTPAQLEQLKKHVEEFYTNHPTKRPPDDMLKDYGGSLYPPDETEMS